MDTTKKRNKSPAMLVDWDHVNAFANYESYVADKDDKLAIVLIVPNPYAYDYEDDALFEPTVVLRNMGGLSDRKFKEQALSIMTEVSNLQVIAAWDDDPDVLEMYRQQGIPFTYDLNWEAPEQW
jgi:hypothetical protein